MRNELIKNSFPTEYKTYERALEVYGLRLKTMAPGAYFRYFPVIIHGPNDGYMVIERRWAKHFEHPIIKG